MYNISGFGFSIYCIASKTFPAGFPITEFADDADPLDVPSLQIADSAMGLNGDLITWSKANPIKITIDVIPSSDDDINLGILLEANRPGKGKTPALDIITMNFIFPEGVFTTLSNGVITDGMPFNSVASAGRLKTKGYQFTFESRIFG